MAAIIKSNYWKWAAARSDHPVALQAALFACVFPNFDADYRLICTGSSGDYFGQVGSWQLVRRRVKVAWHRVTWVKPKVPKVALINWLVLLSRLPTHDRNEEMV